MLDVEFLERVASRAGGPPGEIRRATWAVLAGLGGRLSPSGRDLIANELPESLRPALLNEAIALQAQPLEEHVLDRGMRLTRARELVASVLATLAEVLSEASLVRLRDVLPESAGALLAAAPDPDARAYSRTSSAGSDHSLANANARPAR